MSSFKKFREHLTLLRNIVSQRFLMGNLGIYCLKIFLAKYKLHNNTNTLK